MRFWFEHSSEVSLREQVVTQVTLGILCGELAAGERLPSIRELARRFGLHANTVSAGYRQLEAEGWVESRRGSGVYVREASPATGGKGIERLLANLFAGGQRLGITPEEMVERVQTWAKRPPLQRVLVVEPDKELRAIVVAELGEMTHLPVAGCGFNECAGLAEGALVTALPTKVARVKAELGREVMSLKVRSVPASLADRLPTQRLNLLVGLASRWPDFTRFAKTMLVAAGFDGDALVVRDARQPDWRTGLEGCAGVVCDFVTGQNLNRGIVFRVLGEEVAADLETKLAGLPARSQ